MKDNSKNYNKIFDNGVLHLRAAFLLSENDMYGFAISHLVLGMEEFIKFLLVLHYIKGDNSFDDVIKFTFSSHRKKHGLIKEFQKVITDDFCRKWENYQLKILTGQNLDSDDLAIKNNRFADFGAFLNVAYRDINLSEIEIDKFILWLENIADKQKNKGFYADWKNKNDFYVPSDITKDEYNVVFNYLKAFSLQVKAFKDIDITEDEFMDFLNEPITEEERIALMKSVQRNP